MDITSIGGIVLAIACILGGQALEGGHASSLMQATAAIIVLGGTFGLLHAETHTVILPHAAAYNASAAPAALDRVARALGASKAAGALFDLAAMNGAPISLRQTM